VNRDLLSALRKVVGKEHLLTKREDLVAYSQDAKVRGKNPAAIVRPDSTEQVSRVMAVCHEAGMPVIARGAGTGMVGGAVPESEALVLDLVRMNRILEIAADEQLARVECGVVTARLDAAVGEYGLIYAPDPASSATSTIGGNAATGAGGLRAVKYGVTKHHMLGLQIVLADGRIIETGVRTKKGVVGYDLTELFVGSEGTLGVITELTVRLMPKPEAKRTLVATFEELERAGGCVIRLLAAGVVPTVLEIMDVRTLEAARLDNAEVPDFGAHLLLIEATGRSAQVDVDAETIESICREAGAKDVIAARNEDEAARLWSARKGISTALNKLKPQKKADDITVPIPQMVNLLNTFNSIADEQDLLCAAYGHAGDGNIHANFLFDPADPEESKRVKLAREKLFEAVVEMGGTISGEHGVGSSKRPYIKLELSDTQLDVQRSIKRALDPKNILNPGKIFPR
jgi:glycolate dehydrogenase FAD-linked subunit